MKKSSLLHAVSVVFLVLCTAVLSFGLVKISEKGLEKITALPTENTALSEQTETQEPTDTHTEATTRKIPEISIVYDEPETKIEQENFANTVIIGNSQAQALGNYGLLKDVRFVTKIGLSINKVLTSSEGEPLINGLYGTNAEKVILIFGENELGWPYPKNFISEYKKVINKVREILPDARIYCHAVFPVTKDLSEKSTIGVTNENVTIFNELISEMCEEEGLTFINYSAVFASDSGALPPDAANDGIHFNYDYCKIWASDLSAALEE